MFLLSLGKTQTPFGEMKPRAELEGVPAPAGDAHLPGEGHTPHGRCPNRTYSPQGQTKMLGHDVRNQVKKG